MEMGDQLNIVLIVSLLGGENGTRNGGTRKQTFCVSIDGEAETFLHYPGLRLKKNE
ncbi:hypothetical protein ACFLV0_06960 [Chloroflexota bacterium]